MIKILLKLYLFIFIRRGPGGAGGGRKKLRRKALQETTTHLVNPNDSETTVLT